MIAWCYCNVVVVVDWSLYAVVLIALQWIVLVLTMTVRPSHLLLEMPMNIRVFMLEIVITMDNLVLCISVEYMYLQFAEPLNHGVWDHQNGQYSWCICSWMSHGCLSVWLLSNRIFPQ